MKLLQLSGVARLEKIIVSSNDPIVLDFTDRFRARDPRFVPVERPDALGASSTSMSDFIRHIAQMEEKGVIFWTHVTHPFLTALIYDQIIDAYLEATAEGFDSLITVTRLQKFIWDENGPFNYDGSVEKWPRSQDIKPLFEINHGAYVLPFEIMRGTGDRIGKRLRMYELPEAAAMDIDWEEQFHLLDDLARMRRARGESLL